LKLKPKLFLYINRLIKSICSVEGSVLKNYKTYFHASSDKFDLNDYKIDPTFKLKVQLNYIANSACFVAFVPKGITAQSGLFMLISAAIALNVDILLIKERGCTLPEYLSNYSLPKPQLMQYDVEDKYNLEKFDLDSRKITKKLENYLKPSN
jgi:hypothetical protein